MSPTPTSATPRRRRISGGTLLAWLFVFGLLGGMLFMPSRQSTGTQWDQEAAVAASLAVVTDDPVPPQDAYSLAVHKKRRRTELKPVAAEYAHGSVQQAQHLVLIALSATPAARIARAPTPPSGSLAPTSDTPQLRLRPGQAPPAV